MPGTRKLGRTTDNRMAMLRGMVTLLLETGKVDTTVTRAKEVRCLAEKMITLGKKNTLASRRQALAFITKEDVVKKLFDVITPENAARNGGYTAIYKLTQRRRRRNGAYSPSLRGREGCCRKGFQEEVKEEGRQGGKACRGSRSRDKGSR